MPSLMLLSKSERFLCLAALVGTHQNFLPALSLIRPKVVTGEGLFEVLQQALSKLGIEEVDGDHCQQLIGIGTDGTSAYIANAGLKGIVESKLDWLVWMSCLAHRLELGIKDALKGTYFNGIDDMLICLHYIYERSPKSVLN